MPQFKNLHFARFIAALGVVLFHYASYSVGNAFPSLSPFLGTGGLGVSFFFFLSGTVMITAYPQALSTTHQQKKFFIARFARIYPLVVLTALLVMLLSYLNNTFPSKGDILLQFTLLQAWIPGKNLVVNSPSWSISVEIFFYLLFPLLQKFCLRLSTPKLIGFCFLLWIATIINHHYNIYFLNPHGNNTLGEYLLRFPLFHLNLFLGGMTLGICLARGFKLNHRQGLLFTILGTLLFVYLTVYNKPIQPYLAVATLLPVYLMLVSGLLFLPSSITNVLSSKPAILLGDASYGVYLFQLPVWNFFMQYALPNGFDPGTLTGFFLYLALLLLVSIFTFYFFESPLRKKIRATLNHSS
jgi:peptidoglycan/LPS O-acetylase OafA/YrhL